jgi:hypothetical protein
MKGRDSSRAESGKLSARLVILLCSFLLAACGQQSSEPRVSYRNGVVIATGYTGGSPYAGWQDVLQIRTSDDPSAPLVLGDYDDATPGVIRFIPRYPPSQGVTLYVRYKPFGEPGITASFGEAADAIAPTTRAERIYPSTDEWPANTLKMYVQFSAPMARGDAYRYIRVLDAEGRAVEGPFVEIEPELWDPTGTRLTLLFDPGRIKRGLVDNESSGPPLMPGRSVTIEVDPAMRDARGAPLAEKFTRTIRVTDALRLPVDEKQWRIDAPKSASDDLVIAFPRPLDHALAQRAISISRDGARVAGKVALEDNETRFRFTPESPWRSGRHEILVDGVIEDLAGNRLGKLFDVDTSDPTQSTSATPSATIAFEVVAS